MRLRCSFVVVIAVLVSLLLAGRAAAAGPVNVEAPSVSGVFTLNSTLTASAGSWLGVDPIGYAYAWQRCQAYAQVVAADSPAAYWRLGDSSQATTAADASGNGRSLSVNGAVGFGASAGLSGDPDTATSFDGSSSYLSVADASWLDPASGFSVEVWVKSSSSSGTVVAKPYALGSSVSYALLVSGGYAVAAVDSTGGPVTATSASRIDDGQWHLLDLTFDGSSLRLYVDGASPVSSSVSGTLQFASNALQVGRQDGTGGWFAGSIDDVAFYATALTGSQIAAHNAAGTSLYGVSCSSISNATSAVYLPQASDLGYRLRVEITATDTTGSTNADSFASVVSGSSPVNQSLPTIDGEAQVGQTLTAETGSWAGAAPVTYTYQWSRCGYPAVVLRDQPAGYWRLGETSGTSLANMVSGGSAAIVSGSYALGQTGAIGDGDTAVSFAGGDASVANYNGISPSNAITLEWWFKGTVPASSNWILSKASSSNDQPYLQYGVGVDGSGNVKFALYTQGTLSANTWSTGVPWPTDGNWHYFAITYAASPGTAMLYLDGTPKQAIATPGGGIGSFSTPLYFMHSAWLGGTSQGQLDELAVYDSALSQQQVEDHYEAAIGTSPTCLAISGATSSSYATTSTDLGQSLEVNVTATNSYGSVTATSATTARVGEPPPVNTVLPAISGDAAVSQTFTATAGTWSDPTPTYTFQWQRCGYPAAVLADSPTGFWRLDEVTGTSLANLASPTHPASLSGSAVLGDSGGTGDGDSAVDFTGGDASVGDYSGLDSSSNLTLEWWYRGSVPASAGWMIAKSSTSNSEPYLQYGVGADSSNNINVALYYRSTLALNTWSTGVAWPDDGEWHYFAVTASSSGTALYVDGVQRATGSSYGSMGSFSTPLNFMHATWKGSTTQGELDDVAVYTATLSSAQVAAHWTASLGGNCSAIPGAISSTYTATSSDALSRIRVAVTATTTWGTTTAYSTNSDIVSTGAPLPSTAPAVSGVATEGQTLTTDNGRWGGTGLSYSAQWQRCTTYAGAVLASNPIGYWRLGEAESTLPAGDLGVLGAGTYSNVTTGADSALTGDPETAASFNGSSSAVVLPSGSYPTARAPATIEAWVNATPTSTPEGIAGWGDGSVSGNSSFFLAATQGTGGLVYPEIESMGVTLQSTNQITVGHWHLVDAVDDGTYWLIYIDGTLSGSINPGNTFTKIADYAYIGSDGFSSFSGDLDDVSFYDHALSSTEINDHLAAGRVAPSCSDISSATASSYSAAAADVNTQLRSVITATNGTLTASASSALTPPVAMPAPTLESPDVEGGSGTDTPNLEANAVTGQPTASFAFQIAADKNFNSVLTSSGFLPSTTTWTVPSSAKLKDSGIYYWRAKARYGGQTTGWSGGRKLTVHLNMFGSRSYWPVQSVGMASVNEATGNLILGAGSPTFPTSAGELSVALAFNSLDARDNGLGAGWTVTGGDESGAPPEKLVDHNALSGLQQMDAAEIVWPDGSSDYYAHLGSTNIYLPPDGDTSQLQKNADSTWTLTTSDGSIYAFGAEDSSGDATPTSAEIAAAQASKSTIAYSYSSNRLVSITDANDSARVLHLYWHSLAPTDCPNALLCITGPDNVTWSYIGAGAGGTSGKLATINDGHRDLVAITYNTAGLPITLKDADDLAGSTTHSIAVNYDSSNRVTGISDGPITGQTPATSTWTFAYNTSGPYATDAPRASHPGLVTPRYAAGDTVVTAPDQQGATTPATSTVYYDTLDHPIEVKDPLGRISEASYNGSDQLLWTEDADGNPTDNTWDPDLDVLTTTTAPDPDGSGPLSRPITQYRYDEILPGTSSTAGTALQGLQASYYTSTNLSGRPAKRENDPNVDFAWANGPSNLGHPTSFSVLWRGNLISTQAGDYTFTTTSYAGHSVTLTIDGLQAIRNVGSSATATAATAQPIHLSAGVHALTLAYLAPTQPAGIHLAYACATCANPIASTVIPASELRPAWLNQTSTVTPSGHVTFSHYASPDTGEPDYTLVQNSGQNLITSYLYDSSGRITSKVMPKGNASRTVSTTSGDLNGLVNSVFETNYSYYSPGTTAAPPAACGTASGVDQGGQLATKAIHGVAATSDVYDLAGRVLATTNGRGTTCFTYDSHGEGRLLSAEAPGDSQATTYTYDASGQPLTATNAAGTTTIAYDEAGRPVDLVDSSGAEESSSYDADGNPISRTAAAGLLSSSNRYTTTYAYDAADQLAGETDPAGSSYGFFYDSRGHLDGTQYPNNTFSWADYNSLGEETNLLNRHGTITSTTTSAPSDSSPLSDFSYSYDPDGRKTDESRTVGTAAAQVTDYTYDDAGRLSQVGLPDGSCRRYGYDADSNRTETDSSATGCTGTFATTATYTYDPGITAGIDQLTSQSAATTTNYHYTADGQVDCEGETVSAACTTGTNKLTWDGRGRISGGTFNATTIAYSYDPTGNLKTRTTGTTTTNYLLEDLLETNNTGTITTSYTSGPAGNLASFTGPPTGTPTYLYYNGHGDLAAEANNTGTLTTNHSYDPFGAPNDTPPANTISHRYTGAWDKQTDTTSGLILMGARPYDPTLGRFLTIDPIDGGSPNNYDYTGQDPINQYDLDGTRMACGDPEACQNNFGIPQASEAEAKAQSGVRRSERAQGVTPPTNAEARAQAKNLEYNKVVKDPPLNSHGRLVFTNGKDLISADRDLHQGVRAWKVFDQSGNRTGTWDWNLQHLLGK